MSLHRHIIDSATTMANTHLTDIRIDSSSPASHMGGDGWRPADGAESNEINQLQGKRISDVAIGETQGSATKDKEEVPLPLWLSEITEENTESENIRTEEPCIPKVPHNLKKKNKKCYSPLAVSIGPYHYSDREAKLKQVERLKVPMMLKFVNNGGTTIEDLYLGVKEVLKNARGCYSENLTEHFNDEEFNKMMFIDGCFILQFMHCLNGENDQELKMSDQQIFHVKRDLLLLENQLPFAVLHSLRTKRYGDNLSDSNEIINNFISLHIRPSSKPIPKWIRVALTALRLVMTPIILPLYFVIACCCVCLWYCCLRNHWATHLLREQSVSLDWSPPPPREEKSGKRDDEPQPAHQPPTREEKSGTRDDEPQPAHQPPTREEKSGTRDDEPQPAHPPPTRKEKSGKRDDERQPAHLLELLYYKSMYHYSKSNHKKAAKGSRGHCLYYSAKSLKKVGILFWPISLQ